MARVVVAVLVVLVLVLVVPVCHHFLSMLWVSSPPPSILLLRTSPFHLLAPLHVPRRPHPPPRPPPLPRRRGSMYGRTQILDADLGSNYPSFLFPFLRPLPFLPPARCRTSGSLPQKGGGRALFEGAERSSIGRREGGRRGTKKARTQTSKRRQNHTPTREGRRLEAGRSKKLLDIKGGKISGSRSSSHPEQLRISLAL